MRNEQRIMKIKVDTDRIKLKKTKTVLIGIHTKCSKKANLIGRGRFLNNENI